jgi:hypothetical protein
MVLLLLSSSSSSSWSSHVHLSFAGLQDDGDETPWLLIKEHSALEVRATANQTTIKTEDKTLSS